MIYRLDEEPGRAGRSPCGRRGAGAGMLLLILLDTVTRWVGRLY
jgi:hypothetical protein